MFLLNLITEHAVLAARPKTKSPRFREGFRAWDVVVGQ